MSTEKERSRARRVRSRGMRVGVGKLLFALSLSFLIFIQARGERYKVTRLIIRGTKSFSEVEQTLTYKVLHKGRYEMTRPLKGRGMKGLSTIGRERDA